MENSAVKYEAPPAGFRQVAKNLRAFQGICGYMMDMMGAMANRCDELAEANGEPIEIEENTELDGNGGRQKTLEVISIQVSETAKTAE